MAKQSGDTCGLTIITLYHWTHWVHHEHDDDEANNDTGSMELSVGRLKERREHIACSRNEDATLDKG